jgi:hypothetical protein
MPSDELFDSTPYQTSSQTLNITQSLATNMAATMGTEFLVTKTATPIMARWAKSEAGSAISKRILSKEAGEKIMKFIDRSARKKIATAASKLAADLTKKQGVKLASSIAEKQAAKLAQKQVLKMVEKQAVKEAVDTAAKAGTALAGGCALGGPIGCAVGAVIAFVDIALMVSDIIMTALDLTIGKGLAVVFDKKFIDTMAQSMHDSAVLSYTNDGYPDWYDEEVNFYPMAFIVEYDQAANEYVLADNEWSKRYFELQDEYMLSIGVNPGWESRVATATDLNTKKDEKKKTDNTFIIVMVVLAVIIILIIIYIII